jgi:TolB protein
MRVSADGSVELAFPEKFPVVGASTGTAIYTPDGTEIAVGARSGLAIVENTGAIVGELPVPTVNGGCSVIRWWQPGVALAWCTSPGGAGKVQFWLVPVTGGTPTVLASDPSGSMGVWQTPSGTYTQLAACSVILIAKLNANGSWGVVTVPGVVDNMSETIVGAYGDALEVEATPSCASGKNPPGPSLLWFNTVADRTNVILGPPLNGGEVVGAMSYPGDNS